MPLYEFECDSGHVTELVRSGSTSSVPCSCGLPAGRRAVNRIALGSVESRYAYKDFVEAHAEIEDAHAKVEQREGVKVERPDFYGAAKRQVDQITG